MALKRCAMPIKALDDPIAAVSGFLVLLLGSPMGENPTNPRSSIEDTSKTCCGRKPKVGNLTSDFRQKNVRRKVADKTNHRELTFPSWGKEKSLFKIALGHLWDM